MQRKSLPILFASPPKYFCLFFWIHSNENSNRVRNAKNIRKAMQRIPKKGAKSDRDSNQNIRKKKWDRVVERKTQSTQNEAGVFVCYEI